MEVKKVKFQDISKIGKAIYKDKILDTLLPEDKGKIVVIDVTTGNYLIGDDDTELSLKLEEMNPQSLTWAERVGYRAVYSFGGHIIPVKQDWSQ